MPPRTFPALAVSLSVTLVAPAANADGGGPITNHLAPVQLQWNVIGELGNGMGLRGTANVFLPKLPLFGGVTAGWYYGVDASHVDGSRSGAMTRFFLGHDVLELRAGLDLAGWRPVTIGSHYDYDFQPTVGGTRYRSSRYASAVPAYTRRGLYAGLRYHHPHRGERCGDGGLADNCVDVSPLTLIVGLSLFYAVDVEIDTAEHGRLGLLRHRLIEVRGLYTASDSYARTSLAKQLGAEVLVTYGGFAKIAVMVGAGWDGDMAMLTLGIGAGAPKSFVGRVPDAASIMR